MSGMKIIKPIVLTDAMMVSNYPEPAAGRAWVSGQAYAVGDLVERPTTHRRYKRLFAGGGTAFPENDTANWVDYGPSNKRAMFDRKIGTVTTGPSPLILTMPVGAISGLSLFGLVGEHLSVTYKDAPGGTVAYQKDVELDESTIEDIYGWLCSDIEQLSDLAITDIPRHFFTGELTVTITSSGGSVSCGVLQAGEVIEIGDTKFGSTVGIMFFGKKKRDEWGNLDVDEEGEVSKRMSLKVIIKKSEWEKIYRRLMKLVAIPCAYIGVAEIGFEPMVQYGYYQDFTIEVAYATEYLISIEIEGLT